MKRATWMLFGVAAAAIIPLAAAAQNSSRKVTEVTLERTACFGACPMYTVTLRSDGTATYEGRKFVEKVGRYEGKIWDRDFERLTKVLDKFGYWSMKEKYTLPITDQPSQILTVKSDKATKVVNEYGDSGPEELWAMQLAVDGIVNSVKDWKKVE